MRDLYSTVSADWFSWCISQPDKFFMWRTADEWYVYPTWQKDHLRTPNAAPINRRCRQRVTQLISWREVLETEGYQIITRSRAYQLPLFKEAELVATARRSGQIFIICPFHEERTGSMVLRPSGVFHCFGCGTTGHIVDFVANLNRLKSARAIKQYFADTFPQMQPRTT